MDIALGATLGLFGRYEYPPHLLDLWQFFLEKGSFDDLTMLMSDLGYFSVDRC